MRGGHCPAVPPFAPGVIDGPHPKRRRLRFEIDAGVGLALSLLGLELVVFAALIWSRLA